MAKHILILGGTSEARELAQSLASRTDLAVTMSLAGRTAAPAAQPVPVRRGGFGGIAGLARYLNDSDVSALIDATHPYAAIMSGNAIAASRETGTPMIALRRPPWSAAPGDRWIDVASVEEARHALGVKQRNVFLTLGRQEIASFAEAPWHHYLIRSVDPVDPPLAIPHARYLLDRGPFDEEKERALLLAHSIDVVVAKNSGGAATYGKIAAARALGLEVLLLQRPPLMDHPAVARVSEVIAWLDHVLAAGKDRGV
jgi:precorrin-6A/cobalt-precorrin-6A reductase